MAFDFRYMDKMPAGILPGRLEWIGLRTGRRGPVLQADSAMALAELGLEGDHRCEKIPGSARQVTIISRDYLKQIAEVLSIPPIDPALLRRNLVISGMDMGLLRFQRLQIGDAIFETSALCHPCSRMDAALGSGAKQAMMGRGGLCAKIVKTGRIVLGDEVLLLGPIA